MSPSRPDLGLVQSSRELHSNPPTRARVEICPSLDLIVAPASALGCALTNCSTRPSPSKFLWPLSPGSTVRDVREDIERVVFGAASSSGTMRTRLELGGWTLVDAHRVADVVRDDEVVRLVASDGSIDDKKVISPSGTLAKALARPLAPGVSDGEDGGEDVDGRGPSRSARRKSHKRARRRAEAENEDDNKEEEEDGSNERVRSSIDKSKAGVSTSVYGAELLGEYPTKPRPLRPEDYVHISEPYVHDPNSAMARLLERRAKHEADVRASGADAWEKNVFRCEMPDEEVEEFPLAQALKRSDFIAYKVRYPDESETEYYQGRVMHYDPQTSLVRVKPVQEHRVTAAGELFFQQGQRPRAPFDKFGEITATWVKNAVDPYVRNPFADPVIVSVRLIGGRSVWEGDVPSKIWTSGRKFTKPPSWQPGERETKEQYEEWLEEHIRIHHYQMKNAKKWDDDIARSDRERRRAGNEGRRRPHRHERHSRRDWTDDGAHDANEADGADGEYVEPWPTSAEELQARLMAEWNAAEQQNVSHPTAEPIKDQTPPRPGGLPPRGIPGVSYDAHADQPPPPPGSPPSEAATGKSKEPPASARETRSTRRRARASTAAAMELFRSAGDID